LYGPKITYQNGELRGTPKGQHKDCREIEHAAILSPAYVGMAKTIADRRMIVSGYRLANLMARLNNR
jgi:hypothetical protein